MLTPLKFYQEQKLPGKQKKNEDHVVEVEKAQERKREKLGGLVNKGHGRREIKILERNLKGEREREHVQIVPLYFLGNGFL